MTPKSSLTDFELEGPLKSILDDTKVNEPTGESQVPLHLQQFYNCTGRRGTAFDELNLADPRVRAKAEQLLALDQALFTEKQVIEIIGRRTKSSEIFWRCFKKPSKGRFYVLNTDELFDLAEHLK